MAKEKQHTLKAPITIQGVGLHTGEAVEMTFQPAPEHHGRVFRRTDLEGAPTIEAKVEHVVDTSRGTTLAVNDVSVQTVEHVLAALAGTQVDNVLIDLSGPEPPVMDGSAKDFTTAILDTGLLEQEASREYFAIEEPIHFLDQENQIEYTVFPSEGFHATVMIDFDSSVLKPQFASLSALTQFANKIADARTFCFVRELEELLDAGLIKGGSLENAIVIADEEVSESQAKKLRQLFNKPDAPIETGILNKSGLRHNNEPARHKLLDLIGDLALIGQPIKGHFVVSRPGHSSNVEFARRIQSKIKQKQIARRFMKEEQKGMVFDIKAIQEILPHRYPFLLVDRVLEFSENHIRGIKNVTINEPFFQGHFPGNPIMPGVLQLEAMGQLGGILLLNTIENPQSIWVYFVAIDNARFKRPVVPGDTMMLELEMTALRRSICKMSGKVFVDGNLVCSADLVASVVPKNKL